MRREVEEEGHKIEGEGGVGWQWGALCSALLGGTCLWRGVAAIAILAVVATASAMARVAAWMRSSWIANLQQKGTRGDQDDAKERQRQSPARRAGIWITGVTWG